MKKRITGLLCLTLMLPLGALASQDRADMILVNGNIVTVASGNTRVQALAVRDGRIQALGSSEEIRALADTHTRVIDLHGRTVTPGLIDTHAHIAQGGVDKLYSVPLADARDIAEVRRRIASRAARLKPGEWLLGSGWDEGKLSEHRYLLARDLDDVAPANPVWLEHTTGHYGVANTRALKLAGVTASTVAAAGGTIDRDASGQPTGVLKEGAKALVTDHIPAATPAQLTNGILTSLAEMAREGMTGVKDPAITAAEWDAYESLDRRGKLSAHVCVLWHPEPTLEGARQIATRLSSLPKPPRAVHTNLVSCGVKYFMDGSGGARTAWMYADWNKNRNDLDTGNKGYPLIDPEVYRSAVGLLNAAGIHVATHAIGDRAIDWVVDTYAQVLKGLPPGHLRDAIIHANTPTDHAIEVMADLQRTYDSGYPETQPPFMWWIGDNYAGNLGPARSQRLNPYHTYLERGIIWGGGSDYPVTPLPARYGLWSSVTRTTLSGRYGSQPFGTAEAVDIATALQSYTLWAARQLFLEAEAGSLEQGKSADIAVWDRDMTAVPADRLKDLKCLMTVFRGKVVYEAGAG